MGQKIRMLLFRGLCQLRRITLDSRKSEDVLWLLVSETASWNNNKTTFLFLAAEAAQPKGFCTQE